ncbi:MAG: HDIG domain-containing protein [Opitutales bacterium]|nr:HDIG domain-containing protein [Opitutales bacterium]
MQIFQVGQKKKLRDSTPEQRRGGIGRWLYSAVCVLVFVVLVAVVAFWGRPPHTPIIFKGMQLTFRFDAPFDFSYESAVRKRAKEEEALYNVVPVYRPDMEQINKTLEKYMAAGDAVVENFDELYSTTDRAERLDAILSIFDELKVSDSDEALHNILNRLAMDVSRLIDSCVTAERYKLLTDESIRIFRNLAEDGIADEKNRGTTYSTFLQHGGLTPTEFRRKFSEEVEVFCWRKVFNGFPVERLTQCVPVVVDLFSPLMRPNVVFDAETTTKQKDAAVAAVAPVVVRVEEGTPLLLPGMRVDEEIAERWFAYRSAQSEHETRRLGVSISFLTNLLYVFCVVVIAVIYRSLLIPSGGKPLRRRLLFTGVMSVINILLIRVILELTESETAIQAFGSLGDALVWLSSPAIVAISVSAIAGAPLGILASLFVGAMASLMLGGNIQILMMISVASLIAVKISRNAMKRSTLVRAGFYSGLAMAITAIFIGYYAETSWLQVLANTISAILIGLFYGVVSAGVLSMLEGVFRARTNITFIELADYNHPLLRKLQLVAPGTFHHCVMVSNYAEQAAHEVGANTALCKCAALFHDIGKTFKPEYFTENQGNDRNPHDDITPQMSALIIKSHVRDGAELAAEYHLPERVRDVIEQHHGTSLVGYFFKKAKDLAVAEEGESAVVDEKHFRYDGPKPRSLEAAIIMMCDIVEAASRSLKKITPQAVEDLVSSLIRARIYDGEFDECSITMSQISVIRASLVKSVLHTFHHRVEYPKDAGGVTPSDSVPADKRPKVRVVRKDV